MDRVTDVTKTCRVCLSKSDELTHLRARLPGKDKTLGETVNFVANINIVLEDGLPDKICKDCGTKLDVADTFKQRCLESEVILGLINKGADEFQLTGEYQRRNDKLHSGDTTCVPMFTPCPLFNTFEDIKAEQNTDDYPKYKMKMHIVENYTDEESNDEQDKLDVNDSQPEQSLSKEKGLKMAESVVDNTNKDSTRNTPKVPKLSDLEVGCATADQSKHTDNTTVNNTIKVLTCDKCKYSTDRQTTLNAHMKAHAANKQYSCDTCSYLTTKSTRYKAHLSTHTGDKSYACNVCQNKFSSKTHLDTHMRTHTGDKPYSCKVCNKKCSQLSNLVSHMRTHTGDKPYSCNVCEKKFSQKPHLVDHMRTHTNDKPYACNVCKKNFRTNSTLLAHMRTHTGEKPFSCNVCCKKFSEKAKLVVHIRTHTGEKPYSCSVCAKNFNVKSTLDTHMRIHTGDKPYSCSVCKKNFNQKANLTAHTLRIHTGDSKRQAFRERVD